MYFRLTDFFPVSESLSVYALSKSLNIFKKSFMIDAW